jgi:tripartite-type tricarboxylate transporter receptor subunit TctC
MTGIETMRFAISLLALVLGHAAARAEEPLSFKGKTITIIVASAPGGGTDISGRLIANFLAGHLSGKPSVIVRNVPGAQGVTAMNHFVKQVTPDGLTLTMGSTSQADPLLYRKPSSLFDPTKFPFIGGVGRGGTVLLIRKDAEARLYDKNAAPVVMGSLGGVPRSGMQTTAWGVAFLGWNAKWVVGYPGTSDLLIALERGEIDMTATANLFQIQKFLDTGKFKILTQSGTLRNGQMVPRPEFGDAPLIANLMQNKLTDPVLQQAFNYWVGLTALDKWIALPPKSPENFVQAYREAFQAAFTDPEFAELGKKISDDLEPMSYQDVDFLVQKLGATSPEAITFTSAMLRKQGLEAE